MFVFCMYSPPKKKKKDCTGSLPGQHRWHAFSLKQQRQRDFSARETQFGVRSGSQKGRGKQIWQSKYLSSISTLSIRLIGFCWQCDSGSGWLGWRLGMLIAFHEKGEMGRKIQTRVACRLWIGGPNTVSRLKWNG